MTEKPQFKVWIQLEKNGVTRERYVGLYETGGEARTEAIWLSVALGEACSQYVTAVVVKRDDEIVQSYNIDKEAAEW